MAPSIARPATPFVGRHAELSLLCDLLRDRGRRLVTLVGPPGVGKTRLALEAAGRMGGEFPEGVIEVPLAPVRRADDVLPTLLAAAGASDIGAASPRDQLLRALCARRSLIVVDNVEHVIGCTVLLAEIVAGCPDLIMLVTSRHALEVSAERVMSVAPLAVTDVDAAAPGDAVALLVERLTAAAVSVDTSPPGMRHLAAICRHLDGLPLAIELAAAQARTQPLAAIAAGLERRLPALDRGPQDAEPRHRTMRRAISWSVDLLDGSAARAFRVASVYRGSWTVAGLGALLPDLAADAVAAAANLLARHSLVVVTTAGSETRYQMLEVVRELAEEQLVAAPADGGLAAADRARRLHALFMCALAVDAADALAGPGIRRSLDVLERERDNLRAAVRWAVTQRDTTVAETLCLAQRMLWYVRGPLHEGCEHFALALELPATDAARRSRVLSEAAALERQRGRLTRAAVLCAEATELARGEGDPLLLAGALLQQGFVAHLKGEFELAEQLLGESAELARPRDRLALGRSLHHLGLVAHHGQGDGAAARQLLTEALEICRECSATRQTATVLVGIAEVHRDGGDPGPAWAAMREALQLFAELRDLPVLAYALHGAAAIAASEGRRDRALRLLGAADRVEADTGAPTWPVMRSASAEWLAEATSAVGAARARQLRAEGAAMPPPDAIAYAIAEHDAVSSTLSRREREVAVLIASGLTNRVIAERLFLSERTVEGHVARILTKLDFRTRTQIATWVSLGGASAI